MLRNDFPFTKGDIFFLGIFQKESRLKSSFEKITIISVNSEFVHYYYDDNAWDDYERSHESFMQELDRGTLMLATELTKALI